jgi:hypothetical protein
VYGLDDSKQINFETQTRVRLDTHDTGYLQNNIKELLMNNHTPSLSTADKVKAMNTKCFIAMRLTHE